MSVHEHAWRPAGHVLRCADPDCLAWLPPRRDEPEAAEPMERPARTRKPPKHDPQPVESGNVVELSSRRR